MVQQMGLHTVKASSNLQSAISLNASEAELYALCHGAAHGLALQAYLRDLGLDLPVKIKSDSSSARSFANRRGLGKQRHVQTRYLWLQERVANRHLEVEKVATKYNVSDILTKCCGIETLRRHLTQLGLVAVEPHAEQKTLASA